MLLRSTCSVDALQNLDENCSRWEVLGETEELIVFPHSVREVEAALMVGLTSDSLNKL